jgi:hypothetical protein
MKALSHCDTSPHRSEDARTRRRAGESPFVESPCSLKPIGQPAGTWNPSSLAFPQAACRVLLLFVSLVGVLGCGLLPHAACATEAPPSNRLSRTNLLLYHHQTGKVIVGETKSDWLKRRAEILEGMQRAMGPLPGKLKRCPLSPQTLEEIDCGSFIRRSITYAAEPGSRVPALLLIPKAAIHSKHKFPALLALHPTDMDFGNRVVVEPLRDYYRAYGRDLVERGYVVLAPAYPLMAQYQPDLAALGYQSGTMKAIWDNLRGLDFLQTLPFVQRGRFGAIGHSLGAHNALYTAAFDLRIAVVVSSCGFDSYLDYYGADQANWQPGRGWCQERYMPNLAAYRGRLQDIPFDFHEVLGVLAPRPVFINAPLRDANFRWRSVDEVVAAATPVYRLYGVPQNLQVVHPDCEHDFPPQIRDQAYRFIDTFLSPVRATASPKAPAPKSRLNAPTNQHAFWADHPDTTLTPPPLTMRWTGRANAISNIPTATGIKASSRN